MKKKKKKKIKKEQKNAGSIGLFKLASELDIKSTKLCESEAIQLGRILHKALIKDDINKK